MAFRERLSHLRRAAGLSGKRLAEQVGWAPSKVSRIQTGPQTITDTDVRTWCDAVGVGDEVTAELLAELRAIRLDQARWQSRLRDGHRPVQNEFGAAEQQAKMIRVVETAVVPGLLQTPDYARAVFAGLSAIKGTHDDGVDAVAARLQRQHVLYDGDKHIELLVTESALRAPVGAPDVMAAQYDRLLAVLGVRNVRFGVLPIARQLPFPVMHGWTILDDEVRAETLNTELVTTDPGDLAIYNDALDALWEVAAEGDQARAILTKLAASHIDADQPTSE